jgi:hypothetical protein
MLLEPYWNFHFGLAVAFAREHDRALSDEESNRPLLQRPNNALDRL